MVKIMAKIQLTKHLLSSKQIFWILLSVTISVLPHLPRLPLWFPILLIGVILSRWLTAIKQTKPLPKVIIILITLTAFITIVYFQGFKLNREISVTILAAMTVLKILETNTKRDAWMVVTLCYFVILTRFFYSQDLLLVIYLFLSVLIITHTLFILQHDNKKDFLDKRELKQTLGLLATGLPLAVLFFLFFPRLGSPIWGSPDFFGSGKTGIGDSMSPGSISQLFSDDSTAFRATFKGSIPNNSDLYWRGPVLWDFDGKTWNTNQRQTSKKTFIASNDTGTLVSYEVELEPTGQKYLFALDYVKTAPTGSTLKADQQLITENDINQLRHYTALSQFKAYNSNELLSPEDFARLKYLPPSFNPKTKALIQQWKRQVHSPLELIKKILTHFATDEFYYSYSPPLLMGDTVDQFLFETKSGFCEHYASAFTVMMRAAGIPARIVTGYQGGILNEGYLLVKQSDAHAWAEVWIQNKGWLRVDPTSAVSPLRVEQGSQALIRQNARNWLDNSWSRKLGERYDAIRHNWNKWVREYNATKQKAIFKVIGFDSVNGRAIIIVLGTIILITTLLVLFFLYINRPKRKQSPYDKIQKKFKLLFLKHGLTAEENLGLLEFSKKATEYFPQSKNSIQQFTTLYLRLRFAETENKQANLDNRLLKIIIKIKNELRTKGIKE